MNKKTKLIFITTLLVGLIGLVLAFWAAGVFVDSDEDSMLIHVGSANEVFSTITINGQDANGLVPIGSLKNSPQGSFEFVVIPLDILWSEDQTNYAEGLEGLFTITPTVNLIHSVAPIDNLAYDDAYKLIHVYFITSNQVDKSDIESSLISVEGSDADSFYNKLFKLDSDVATGSFEVELTIQEPKTVYLVAFISMPNIETFPYIFESIISINLAIKVNSGQNEPIPIIPIGPINFDQVTGSSASSFAIDTYGRLWSWGSNLNGKLGINSADSTQKILTPTLIPITNAMKGVKYVEVSSGSNHVLALDDAGNIWGWGDNLAGQLGLGHLESPVTAPILIETETTFKAISAGQSFSVAICADDYLWSWGSQANFKLGDGIDTITYQTIPQLIPEMNGKQFKAIGAGSHHTIAIDIDGYLWGWGTNSGGQVGLASSYTYVQKPTIITATQGRVFTKISIACYTYSVALDYAGQIWTWGENGNYALGYNINTSKIYTPRQITNSSNNVFIDIAAGTYHVIALDNQGQLFGWGNGSLGALGPSGYIYTPTLIPSPVNIVKISAGSQHTFVIDIDGNTFYTGWNSDGQLGNGVYGTGTNVFGFTIYSVKGPLE